LQAKLQASYKNLTPTHFAETEIPGVYELMTSGRMMYFMPEHEILIVGELYDKFGLSLTAKRKKELQLAKLDSVDLSEALVIGEGSKTVIEFTDPDCPYCLKLHEDLTNRNDVKRYIYFSILDKIHPKATAKAVHIFCSTDQQVALNEIITNQKNSSQLINCDHGRQMVARHKEISENFGVSGTPTVVLGDSVVTGYRSAVIAQFLETQ